MGPGRLFPLMLAGMLAAGGPAWAQNYPERSIKLVVPFSPAGAADVMGRLWADGMKTLLGPVFLENQAGAGGVVGATAVARARPDGYTLMLSTGGPVFVAVVGHVPYDPAKDFEPVSILGTTALTIVIHPSVPARDLKEFIDYAKANPGKLSYGSAGVGTMTHLAGGLFKSLTGTDIVHVAYKGGGQLVADVVSGHIPMGMQNLTGLIIDLHRAGKVRMLATTGPARAVVAPEIPSAAEEGLPGMIARNFFGLFAPAGTPEAVVARIVDATRAAMADPGFRQKLVATGFEPYPDSTREAARRFVQEEVGRWAPVIQAIGSKPERED